MSLYRWSFGFLRLGALLLAIGLIPEALAALMGAASALTALLVLSVAPLGAVIFLAGLVMLAVAVVRTRLLR